MITLCEAPSGNHSSFILHPSYFLPFLFHPAFEVDDFFDAPRVAAAFEGRVQPEFDHAVDQPLAQQIGGEAQDIRIVVPPAELGREIVVAGRGANAVKLIRGDAHAQARPADQYPAVGLAVADAAGHFGGDVGIIDGLGRKRAHVFDFVPELLQQFRYFRADGKTTMIGTNCNSHFLL